MHTPTDADLVTRARSSDAAARTCLLERYQHSVFAFVCARLDDRATAEDLAQDVFVAALTHLEQLEDPERFAGWLFGIARAKLLKHWRRQRRRREGPSADLDRLPAPAPRPEPETRMAQLLQGLPDDAQAVLLLRFRDGLSYKAIAGRLGIPTGTVGTILHRSRAQLRSRLRRKGALS